MEDTALSTFDLFHGIITTFYKKESEVAQNYYKQLAQGHTAG